MRLLMWLALAVLVIFALRKKSQTLSSPDNPSNVRPPANNDTGETMLCCERCQVYFPASEAVLRGEKVYCCAAHADQA
ncbi:MAG: PP0621 family protein [Pseudomonadota bacterium]